MPKFTLKWYGQEAKEAVRREAAGGLRDAGEHLKGESQREVPHEEGTLERSARTDVDESALTAVVSYDTPYAVRQHEDMSYRHNAGRKAKYLQDPFNREQGNMIRHIGNRIKKALG